MTLSRREQIARAILGPHKPLPETCKFTMDELRDVVWNHQSNDSDRFQALRAADAILDLDFMKECLYPPETVEG